MERADIISALRNNKAVMLEKFGVEEIALFGSYARNEQTSESDIDVLVTLKEPQLSKLVGTMEFLENMFHKKIDIVAKHKYLSARFWSVVGDDIIYV